MKKKVLILGARGMLGHKLVYQLAQSRIYDVYGTIAGPPEDQALLPFNLGDNLICDFEAEDITALDHLFDSIQPDIVINCIAKTKTPQILSNMLSAININSRLPHLLAKYCRTIQARLIHISTDSLFGDNHGNYIEQSGIITSDAYSMTKFLGEVADPGSITIRTSIIGHELTGKSGFLEWFLSQGDRVKGYTNVIYTGLPTIELAEVIINFVLPDNNLTGIYHIGSEPISKYEILKLVSTSYKKDIEIEADREKKMNRSLNSSKFQAATGYKPPSWQHLVNKMHQDYIKLKTWYQ